MRTSIVATAILLALGLGQADAATHHHKAARKAAPAPGASGPSVQEELASRDREISALKSAVSDLESKVASLEQRTDAQSDINVAIQQNVETLQTSAKKTDKLEKLVNDTTVGGRVFVDLSDIEQKKNGVRTAASGYGLDVKRGYLTVGHTFNEIWSANLVTDFTYVTADGLTQLFIKNLYLQGKFSDAFVFRAGAIPMAWTPYVENFYGYRYVENTLTDKEKVANTADWGLSANGKFADGMLDYAGAAVNGGGYKNATRSKRMDFEGRLAFSPFDGFAIALGGYSGDRDQETQTADAIHNASRGDAMIAWAKGNNRLGVEYFQANDWNSVLSPLRDKSQGWSAWGSLGFTSNLSVFGRYDHVNLTPNRAVALTNHDKYYNLGLQWDVRKGVKLAAVYKNTNFEDNVAKATTKTQEFGIFGDISF